MRSAKAHRRGTLYVSVPRDARYAGGTYGIHPLCDMLRLYIPHVASIKDSMSYRMFHIYRRKCLCMKVVAFLYIGVAYCMCRRGITVFTSLHTTRETGSYSHHSTLCKYIRCGLLHIYAKYLGDVRLGSGYSSTTRVRSRAKKSWVPRS